MPISICPTCETQRAHKWYQEKIFITSFIFVIILVVSYFLPFLHLLFRALIDYLKLIWWAILLGVFIGGIIDQFIPHELIVKFLAQPSKKTIFYAVVFGFLMSACSHGILAIAMALYKKGASIPAVIAFLLASPWANLPITILLFGFFNIKALFLIISAIIIAIITGFFYRIIEKKQGFGEIKQYIECDNHSHEEAKIKLTIKKWFKSSWVLSKMVIWWILIGTIIASLSRAFIPHHLFLQYMGPTFFGLIITLIFATAIEVCSEGSAPLAFEIFNQTKAFGNSMIFLMAGVATDYTEIGLIWHNIGKKPAVLLPLITVPQILILGYLFNILF